MTAEPMPYTREEMAEVKAAVVRHTYVSQRRLIATIAAKDAEIARLREGCEKALRYHTIPGSGYESYLIEDLRAALARGDAAVEQTEGSV